MASLRISLRKGERIFVNGAVLKADRKTTLEFLNNVTFLMESHVMQAEEATTPLRQLYFVVQMILIDPGNASAATQMFARTHSLLLASFANAQVRHGLLDVGELVAGGRAFDALKRLRELFPVEAEILAGDEPEPAGNPADLLLLQTAGA